MQKKSRYRLNPNLPLPSQGEELKKVETPLDANAAGIARCPWGVRHVRQCLRCAACFNFDTVSPTSRTRLRLHHRCFALRHTILGANTERRTRRFLVGTFVPMS